MTFLSPIPAMVAAAITVPILVAFFLLKLRRRPVRVGSTMLWDQAVRDLQANVPFRWLRPSWMLLLSILILALLLLALARPAIDSSASRADLVIIIIDRSASMSATDASNGRTRLDEAKLRASKLTASLRRGGFSGLASVITSASEARTVASLTHNLASINHAIEAIEPSDQVGDLGGALAVAESQIATILAGRGEDAGGINAVVTIFSDGGDSSKEPLTIAGATPRFDRIAPESPLDNIAITALSASRDFEDPTIVHAFIRLQSTDPDAGATVILSREGEILGRSSVAFEPSPAGQPTADRPLTFEFIDREGGMLLVTIDRPDALSSDDTAAMYLPPPTRPAIVVVRDGPATDAARLILDAVLGELRPRSLEFITNPNDPSPTDRLLIQSADLVLLDAAMLPQSITLDVPIIAFDLTPKQIEPQDANDFQPQTIGPTTVLSWQREHPIMRDVTMDAVVISKGVQLPADGRFRSLAMGREGPLISLWNRPQGDALLIGFDLYYSNWIDFGLPIFLANAVDYLTGAASDAQAISYSTSELITLTPAPGENHISIMDSNGQAVLQRDADQSSRELSMGVLDRSGIYTVLGASVPALATNLLSASESAIASPEKLRIGGRTLHSGQLQAVRPAEIWPWFVIAAAVLLTLEWVLYALRMRV